MKILIKTIRRNYYEGDLKGYVKNHDSAKVINSQSIVHPVIPLLKWSDGALENHEKTDR